MFFKVFSVFPAVFKVVFSSFFFPYRKKKKKKKKEKKVTVIFSNPRPTPN